MLPDETSSIDAVPKPRPEETSEAPTLPPVQAIPPVFDPYATRPETTAPLPGDGAAPQGWPSVPGYEILRELGRGGMGVVYQARHLRLDRLVALKMILAGVHAGPEAQARFRREAEAVARLQHPHVVQVYEVGERPEGPYFALEFAEGGSLDRKLQGTPMPARQAAELIEVLARAVHAAHEKGIVHRDLKPGNVLLTADGAPKVTDFGLAKRLDSAVQQTMSGSILGTPSYMAPEQAEGKVREIGPAVDVYALGAILYECLTGRPPFRAETPLDTVLQVVNDEPVPPSRLQPKVPRDLETICLKCLEKEARKRYESAAALADDLRRFQAGEPISARPVSRWERGWRWCRRNPAVAALLVALIVVFLGGFAGVTWNWQTAVAQQAEAEQRRQQAEDAERKAAAHAAAEERAKAQEEQARKRAETQFQNARHANYLFRITEAGRELTANNLGRAEQLLWECPRDLRQWEWHYLRGLCRTELATYPLAPNSKLLALRADGQRVLVAHSRAVGLWDATNGRHLRDFGPVLGHNPVGLAVSADGRRAAAAGTSVPSGAQLLQDIFGVSLPGGAQELKVWDAGTGKELHIRKGQPTDFHALAFAPDGTRLAFATGGAVVVWDVDAGRPAAHLEAVRGTVTALAFSSDGQRLACATQDRAQSGRSAEVRLWDLAAPAERPAPPRLVLTGLGDAAMCLRFGPGGKLLAAGGADGGVLLWETTGGRLLLGLRGHTGPVRDVAFRADGRRCATAGADRAVKVWELPSGSELFTLRGHTGAVFGVAYSADGKRLTSVDCNQGGAPGGGLGEIKVWDAEQAPGQRAWDARARGFFTPAFSPDGKLLATGGGTPGLPLPVGAVRLWDSHTGTLVREMRGQGVAVTSLAFRPDGGLLASGSLDVRLFPFRIQGAVKLWDPATGKQVGSEVHPGPVLALAFSPDGRWLASGTGMPGDRPGNLFLWSAATGARIWSRELPAAVSGLAFSPDSKRLAILTGDMPNNRWRSEALLLDVARQEVVAKYSDPEADFAPFMGVAFSPDGKRLAVGSFVQRICLFDLEGEPREPTRLLGHSSFVTGVAFSPHGQQLASATISLDDGRGEVKLWDVAAGRELLTLDGSLAVTFSPDGKRLAAFAGTLARAQVRVWGLTAAGPSGFTAGRPHRGDLIALAVSPDGRQLLSGSHEDQSIRVWDLDDRRDGAEFDQLRGHRGGVLALAFSADGKQIASGARDSTARVWDAATGEPLHTLRGHGNSISAVAFSPDGRRLATGSLDSTVKVWDAVTGADLHTLRGHAGWLRSVAFSPDGRRLFTVGTSNDNAADNNTIKVWDAVTGDLLHDLTGHAAGIWDIAFSPDGNQFVTASQDKTLKLWDAATLKPLRTLEGHTDEVRSAAFSPDGRRLSSGGKDRTVRLWDVATGRELGQVQPHEHEVWRVAFHPDGKRVLSTGLDMTIRVTDMATLEGKKAERQR